jgi:C4-dicarboxylate-specific signal transduction histidine kinase
MSSAATEAPAFEARYRQSLTAYLGQVAEETLLIAALELGRTAIARGYSLLDLLALHHATAVSVLYCAPRGAEIELLLTRANEFLSQVAAPFEMAHRGWHQMADHLRLANEELEKRIEERTAAHREAEERLDRAQQIARIGSWELDVATGRLVWSKEMYRICGIPEGAGAPANDIVAAIFDEDRELYDQWFAHLQSGRRPGPIEYRITHRDSRHCHVRAYGDVLEAANGAVTRISCTIQDITEQKAAEDQLYALQEELAHFSRLNTIGHMASALAHELNQPLTAISNYLRGASRLLDNMSDELSPTLRHAFDNASHQAIRAGNIVQRLRDFMARRETEFRVESIKKLLDEAGSLALLGVKDGSVQAAFRLDPGVDLVLVDKIQIEQVLLNLLRNAMEAMQASDQRKLVVSTEAAEDNMILISVADTGPGISEHVAARLFQPFVTSKEHGMGVGLSISRTMIESHGGRIWFEPNPGGGTIFRLTLRAVVTEDT